MQGKYAYIMLLRGLRDKQEFDWNSELILVQQLQWSIGKKAQLMDLVLLPSLSICIDRFPVIAPLACKYTSAVELIAAKIPSPTITYIKAGAVLKPCNLQVNGANYWEIQA